ncbi:Ribosomal protein S18 acetylase RimI [Flaviramulus basaltis]|uniref:Ribosomal protein S18 acetylase RimI n=1 Tax=Flaviramulus basaltis TaxID=369401 RepID=A0A1K2IAH2_9FLAO|nr:GNAT family N-acetyltransferase [Flaviramulus basaltis]SFZ89405.1 Ribosomal protein S18 acetylase RimI [Flaviramulus basaltis]
MKPSIRKATLKDSPILLAFEQGVIEAERPFDPTIKNGEINYYNIPELITSNDSEVFVAEINNEIIASGYAKIKTDRHYLKHEYQGYLGFMFVSKHHRGKQLNKLIIDALLKWCKDKNINEIRLDVYNDNIPAIKAYEKAGFKKHMINMRLDITKLDL